MTQSSVVLPVENIQGKLPKSVTFWMKTKCYWPTQTKERHTSLDLTKPLYVKPEVRKGVKADHDFVSLISRKEPLDNDNSEERANVTNES